MDDELAALKARVAELETTPQPVPVYVTQAPGKASAAKVVLYVLVGIALLIIMIVLFGRAPESPRQLADRTERECVENNGNGDWVASSGITLATFCKLVGAMKGTEADRREHPERY